MAEAFPPGWHEVVRANFENTAGYIVAQSGTCLEFQTKEIKHPKGRVRGRDFRPLTPASLRDLRLPRSWFLGIILCPEDSLEPLSGWHAGLKPEDRDRVVFFTHNDFQREQLDDIAEIEGALPQVVPLPSSWERFHQIFGRLHGDRVYSDHGPPHDPK
ncbi:MAG TPA: hypothetical protein VGB18_02115 [Candidatus Thermoplasmatota archaeon]